MSIFSGEAGNNNSAEDHIPIKNDKKKKDKKDGSNDGAIKHTSDQVPATIKPHRKGVQEAQPVTIAPLVGNQLVSTNVFEKKELKPNENQKKKRKGLKNKGVLLAGKKDEVAEGNLIKARNRNLVADGDDPNKDGLDSDLLEKKCDLCERPRPIFVVDTDDMIKRLPERFLSPLLKNLKKDFSNKR